MSRPEARRSIKPTFDSEFGATRKISAQHKIAEIICSRIAERDRVEIPNRFWQNEAWKKTFNWKCIQASGLFKIYDPQAIINALYEKPGLWSLRSSSFLTEVEKQQEKIDPGFRERTFAIDEVEDQGKTQAD